MRKLVTGLVLGSLLSLSISAVNLRGKSMLADDEKKETRETEAAQKAILDLAKDIEAGKDGKAKAEAIRKKFEDFATVMRIYKPRDKGGLGVGEKGNGIEAQLASIGGKKGITKTELMSLKNNLIKVAYVNIAIADVAKVYPGRFARNNAARMWREYTDGMRATSRELVKAVQSGDPDKVKKASANINAICNNCHADFRDLD